MCKPSWRAMRSNLRSRGNRHEGPQIEDSNGEASSDALDLGRNRGHACVVRDLTQGPALALTHVSQHISDFLAKDWHGVLLGLWGSCWNRLSGRQPTGDSVDGNRLLHHVYWFLLYEFWERAGRPDCQPPGQLPCITRSP